MKPSAVACPQCGGLSLRRSRRKAWFEFVGMVVGRYPFRCLDCNERVWISIWMFSQLIYAKCPKCLNTELTTWSRKHHHLSFWQNLMATFGARRYRCAPCRNNFLSFRPAQHPIADAGLSGEQEEIETPEIISETKTEH